MVTEFDVELPDGRVLHGYDTGGDDRLPVVWHHGTPNLGTPPAPLFPAAERLGLRWIGYDRPGYGGSTARPGRDVASAAGDTAAVVDARGLSRFAVMGHSGGGPHALACAALLGDRVTAAVSGAGLAPYGSADLDYFTGMAPGGEAGLRAAVAGRAAKEKHEAESTFDETSFIPADYAALSGQWSWFHSVVVPAQANGPGPLIDDDLAYVGDWGFDPAAVAAPLLILHGGGDRVVPASHGVWLSEHCPTARLHLEAEAGHISVLAEAEVALEFLAEVA